MARDPQGGSFNLPVVDEQTKIQAMREQQPVSSPTLTRAQQVTAARLASSPIAQEAARTTAALKSFTEKGGLLGVPGSNVQGTVGTGAATPATGSAAVAGKTVNSTYVDPITGDVIAVYSDGTNGVLSKGTKQLEADIAAKTKAATDQATRQSAYDLLYSEFDRYGLGSLVNPLKDLITSGASPSEFTIRLRETDAYKKRFAANEARIKNGLRALSESEYIRNEDAYQEVMRRRGLPESYYSRGDMGIQKGFEALLAGDVSSTELEDRIVTAQDRVLNANPEVAQALKAFYPGISNGDILAYSLDPANALNAIKRKITTAEIGGAAARSGLTTNVEDAGYLERYGVTKGQAEQGYGVIAGGLERGSQLASMYQQDPYTQATAETEIFKVPGAEEARKQRQKLTGLEQATFTGRTGVSSSALARDRAGGY
jgi:hypothetical protein